MEGLAKKRFTVWMIIFILLLLVGGGGVALYFMGYGSAGEVKKEVSSYVAKFNNLSAVKNINNSEDTKMKAALTKSGVEVTYTGKSGQSKTKFTYKNDSGLKYLETSYNRTEADAEDIVKYMIDAVSVINGNQEGKVFETHNYNDFYNTTLKQGVRISSTGSSVTVKINLGTNLLANIDSGSDDGDSQDIQQLVILEDTNSKFSDYINFTTPEGFEANGSSFQKSTDNNTCVATFEVVSTSTASDANGLISMISKIKNAEPTVETINDQEWTSLEFVHSLGGLQTDYVIEIDGKVLLLEYEEYYDNNECKEYLKTITKSLTKAN